MMPDSVIYAANVPFLELRGDQAVFGGKGEKTWHWGDDEGRREIAECEFVIDRRYWELLGKPDSIAVGFSTVEGWHEQWAERKEVEQ
jgi:hypothetical protein